MIAAVLAQSQNLSRFETAFVGLVDRALTSPLLVVGAVAAALAVGAFHALAPGHGKAVAAAYLVGGRGRRRDALLLGAIVAAMHATSVLLLGLAFGLVLRRSGSAASADALAPALRVASGVVVALLGAFLAWRQWRRRGHTHHHDHPDVAPFSRRGLVLLGMSGGLLPAPSAFLVLVTTAFTGHLVFGVVLVLMFSIGMAATLTGIGLAVVRGRDALIDRVGSATQQRLIMIAARVGAAVVLVGGVIMTVAGVAAL